MIISVEEWHLLLYTSVQYTIQITTWPSRTRFSNIRDHLNRTRLSLSSLACLKTRARILCQQYCIKYCIVYTVPFAPHNQGYTVKKIFFTFVTFRDFCLKIRSKKITLRLSHKWILIFWIFLRVSSAMLSLGN